MRAKAVSTLVLWMALAVGISGTAAAAKNQLTLHVLSNRANLVSGPEVLASVTLPAEVVPSTVTVTLNGANVSSEFAMRPNGSFEGLVSGLKLGKNVLAAKARHARAGRIEISDHPIGGPVIGGPQIEPWRCENSHPTDAKCDEAPTYSYEYKNALTGHFMEYNPSSPPTAALIESVTTENGTTVPFIIRTETGYEDRDEYQVTALFQPGEPWTAWEPQQQFSHKLLITGGSGADSNTSPAAPLRRRKKRRNQRSTRGSR